MKSKGAGQPIEPQSDLRQRVQSLRLPDDDPSTSGRRRWIWVIVLLVVLGGGYVAYSELVERQDRPASPPTPSAASQPAASTGVNISTTAKTSSSDSGAQSASPAAKSSSPAAVASSGEIAHESKGYIIPAHQILGQPQSAWHAHDAEDRGRPAGEEGRHSGATGNHRLRSGLPAQPGCHGDRGAKAVGTGERQPPGGNRPGASGTSGSAGPRRSAKGRMAAHQPSFAKAAWPPKANTIWPKQIQSQRPPAWNDCKRRTT